MMARSRTERVLPLPGINATIPPRMSMLNRLLFLLVIAIPLSAEAVWTLHASDWARPRHGEWLINHPPLQEAVIALQHSPQSRLQLRYPGGDEGMLWVEELHAWLVALGVESTRIEVLPGSGEEAAIQIEVVTAVKRALP